MRLLLETIAAIREVVGSHFPMAVKLNSSDRLEGGFSQEDALRVVAALDESSIDLIDISGGTYFPGAKSASDDAGRGPYFLEFAKRARTRTTKPLMLTGGFKTHAQVEMALASGSVDVVGLARALALEPNLPNLWKENQKHDPIFPRFAETPEGGVTAWYTMRLAEIGTGSKAAAIGDIWQAMSDYEERDRSRTEIWLRHFGT